ncbi:MAG: hypothetical protein QT02_C0001G0036 [archaeon GW2011_AR9]|nr:MAG: hypothetical protein QT02_C0001G0036 [archaeon GW2011_AR9]
MKLKPAPLTPVFMAWCLPLARTGTLCVRLETKKEASLYNQNKELRPIGVKPVGFSPLRFSNGVTFDGDVCPP